MTNSDLERMFFDPNEKPLDTFVTDGGFAGVFRTVGFIGDSLSSGEFVARNEKNELTYHDMFDWSWGQYMARMAGFTAINMSRGGMSAKWYMDTFADENDYWNRGLACQAYFVALGCNDIGAVLRGEIELGDPDTDICPDDWTKNAATVTGYYAQIIQKIRAAQPDVHFFLVTMPLQWNDDEVKDATEEQKPYVNNVLAWNRNIRRIAEMLPRLWVIDLEKYAPRYDRGFRDQFFMDGHLTPAGYLLTGKMMVSYMDYIIRHNLDCFHQIGFYGTELNNTEYKR